MEGSHFAIINKNSGLIRMILSLELSGIRLRKAKSQYLQLCNKDECIVRINKLLYVDHFRKIKKYDFNNKNWIAI